MDGPSEERDHLDDMLPVWEREIPDLDPLTEGVVERIQMLARAFDRSMDDTLKEQGLDRRAYYLLMRLRSYGPPYRQSAGRLAEDMHISSGAMTYRLDRLEADGLIRRLPDPSDRRGTLVEPTDLGHEMWDRTVGLQARREATTASVLDVEEKRSLYVLLRRLQRAFPEKSSTKGRAGRGPADEEAGPSSG